jgi:hypothetical protein
VVQDQNQGLLVEFTVILPPATDCRKSTTFQTRRPSTCYR